MEIVRAGVVTSVAVRAAVVCVEGAVVRGGWEARLGGEDVMRPAAEVVVEAATSVVEAVVAAAAASSYVYSVSGPPALAQS